MLNFSEAPRLLILIKNIPTLFYAEFYHILNYLPYSFFCFVLNLKYAIRVCLLSFLTYNFRLIASVKM